MIKPITLFDYAGNYTEIWFIDKMKSYNSRGGKKEDSSAFFTHKRFTEMRG